MNFWKLITWSNEEIKVKPENVEFIQNKLSTGTGFIKTPTRSLSVKDIKDFIETDEPYSDQRLIESGARAFNMPVYHGEAVICRWVKKSVPRREYIKYYAPHPGYRIIESDDNHVLIAWRCPVHQITQQMDELTENEELNLSTII